MPVFKQQELHHIVIVGGGAGGLELATRLGNKLGAKGLANITLLDASLVHIWKPLLHEVAAGSLDAETNAVNFRAHARQHHYHFQLGSMSGIDRAAKQITIATLVDDEGKVIVAERPLAYDTLVIAVGSSANDFGTPGVREHCLFLDQLSEARRFHHLLLNLFLQRNFSTAQPLQPLHIVIIGAGATGVELAAELRLASRELPGYGMSHLQPEQVGITLIEAAPRILPALPERLAAAAQRELDRLSIRVITANPVAQAHATGLLLKDGTAIDADLKVWAAGIKAPDFLARLDGLAVNRTNQLVVQQDLRCPDDAAIFALGDCAACPQPGSDRLVPPRAQSAHQQAATLAKSLRLRLQGKPPLHYVYRDYGSLISFSRYTTVGNLMGNLSGRNLFIEGRVARLFYISLYRMHQVVLHGYLRTALIWLGDKINRALHPRLKLH